MNWLCWHVGASVDPKLKLIAKRTGASLSQVIHAWVYHLERAAEGDPRGTFGIIDQDEAELDTDIPGPIWMAVTLAFTDRGLISDGKIVNFDKRNYGNSTLRVQAFRERQKRLKQSETLQLANETLHETEKRSCNATGQDRTGHTNTPLPPVNGGIDRFANRRKRNGANGHASLGLIDAEESKWRARLSSFKKSGAWMHDQFGPKPGDPDCAAPQNLIREILG